MVYKSLKEICEIAEKEKIPFWKVIQEMTVSNARQRKKILLNK